MVVSKFCSDTLQFVDCLTRISIKLLHLEAVREQVLLENVQEGEEKRCCPCTPFCFWVTRVAFNISSLCGYIDCLYRLRWSRLTNCRCTFMCLKPSVCFCVMFPCSLSLLLRKMIEHRQRRWVRPVAIPTLEHTFPEMILGPSLTTKTRLLSFNRTQSRVVIDLTGQNTLRRYLYLMGLTNNPSCRRCGTEEETSFHLCECEVLASLRHAYLGSFCLDPEDVKESMSGGHLKL